MDRSWYPDLDRAMEFYRALFDWEYEVGPAETGHYTTCLLNGRPVAAIMPNPDPDATAFWWNMYLATADCDGTAKRITDAGGTFIDAPMDVMGQGRMAIARDPVGAQFGLWQGRAHIGAQIFGVPETPSSRWATTFEVADTDAVVARARAAGGTSGDVEDMQYGRIATITDPFGIEFSVITRPASPPG